MQIPFLTNMLFVSSMLGIAPGIVSFEQSASELITADSLRAHVAYLASDELEGRGLGSEGLAKAATYLAEQLAAAGLQPAGDDGTFLQAVALERSVSSAVPEMSLLDANGEARALSYGAEFRVYLPSAAGRFDVLLLDEASDLPEGLPANTLLCFPDLTRSKVYRWLEEQGHPRASGLAGVITFLRRAGTATDSPPRDGRIGLKEDAPSQQPLWLELSPDLRAAFAAGEVQAVDVDAHFSMEQILTHNVIGRLPSRADGTRPELAKQAVVVTAHFDHLGKLSPERGKQRENGEVDLINNGADDDASGVATVLEIARALASEGPQEREVLFLLATAEEIGVVGTKHYLDHPSTPLDRTVANLNFEMVGRADPKAGGPGRLWLTGAERTNLMEAFLANDFMIVVDPYPEQNFFSRSDNIEFCKRGIVGQTFSTYNLHGDYHQVTDETATLDFEHMQSCARAGLQAVRLVADGTIDPEWLPGGKPEPRRR